VSEVAEAVPEESAVGTESAAVVPTPPPTREGQEVPPPQPAEAATSTSTATAADMAEGIVGEAGPSSPRSVATSAEEVLMLGKPTGALQEGVALEGTARAASPKIQ
jgi:hypothetical protein